MLVTVLFLKCKSALMLFFLTVNSLLNGNQYMNKFVSVLVLGCALALSACGGDSDSSGSSSSSEPIQFQGLNDCPIVNNNITVRSYDRGCLVKKSNINKGKTFALSCQDFTVPGGPQNARFSIKTTTDADIGSIERDIKTFDKYTYTCQRSSLTSPIS